MARRKALRGCGFVADGEADRAYATNAPCGALPPLMVTRGNCSHLGRRWRRENARAWLFEIFIRSPHERSDMRDNADPAYRCAHAGYELLADLRAVAVEP